MVIDAEGTEWGTAAEVAKVLSAEDDKVTAAMVRQWARRDGLPKIATRRASGRRAEVRYPVAAAGAIARDKALGGRGRPRGGLTTTGGMVHDLFTSPTGEMCPQPS